MSESPVARDYTIEAGDNRVAVVDVGAALRSLEVGDRELLDTFPAGGAPTGGRGVVLAPWPNRLRDGRYSWRNRPYQLPVNEPETDTALHGLVSDIPWWVVDHSATEVTLTCRPPLQHGFPFWLAIDVTYTVDVHGLTVTTTCRNAGALVAPFGLGHHPYIASPGTAFVDGCELQVAAELCLQPDERGLPRQARPVDGTPYDFSSPRAIGDLQLDLSFAGLQRNGDGRGEVVVTGPDGTGTALWFDEAYRYIHVYSGDTLPDGERRRSLAIEPMTCPANALQSGTDIITLAPGAEMTARWGIRALSSR